MASGRERTAAAHRLSRRLPAIDTSLSCFQATDEVPMVQEQHLLQQQAAPPGAGFQPWVPPPAHTLTREHTHLQNSLLQVNGRLTKLDLSVSSVKFTHSSALPPPRQSQPMGLQEPQGIKMHLLMHVCAALLCYCCLCVFIELNSYRVLELVSALSSTLVHSASLHPTPAPPPPYHLHPPHPHHHHQPPLSTLHFSLTGRG